MMLFVWLGLGVGALLVFSVLGYGLFGHAHRLRVAVAQARRAVLPKAAELTSGIQAAQALRMQDGVNAPPGRGRHA